MPSRRVAVVVPLFANGGGVTTLAVAMLRQIAEWGDDYRADVFSLAMSSRDRASLRLLSPASWFRGPGVEEGSYRGYAYRHFGAVAAEVEFQRYRPRPLLTETLNDYDLVQVIAGTTAWSLVARDVRRPVVLWAATLTELERSSMLAESTGLTRLRRRWMTDVINRLDIEGPRHVDHTFALNRVLMGRLREHLGPDRVSLALPGIDTELFRPATGRSDGFILSVARFGDPRKNLPMLLRAYHQLRRQLPDAPRLLLASASRPSPRDWGLVESLGLTGHVELRLGLPDADLAQLYRDAALFVLSSNEEGLGFVALEAMASGTPVVSTRCGGPEEVVVEGETGFLTPLNDPEALVARMRDLVASPPLRRAMGTAARAIVEERFSFAAAGRVFLDKYDELLGTGRGSARHEPRPVREGA